MRVMTVQLTVVGAAQSYNVSALVAIGPALAVPSIDDEVPDH